MELNDCAFLTLNKVTATSDAGIAFKDCNFAMLVGARPRGPGMERKDLLLENAKIFSAQGKALDAVADLIGDAVSKNRLRPIDPAVGAAVIMGVILQSATFHIYGRLSGSLSTRAPALARAAIAAVVALTQ